MFSVDTQQLKNAKLNSITELTNHVDVNLKPWFLIKSGYYIVPGPSTALIFTYVPRRSTWYLKWSTSQVQTYFMSPLETPVQTYL